MRLMLVRHGNTFEKGEIPLQVGARTDLPLTSFGKEQAKGVLKYILKKKIPLQAIYTGTLKRQKESAQIIGHHFNLPCQITEALTEIDYGKWEGLPSETIKTGWPEDYRAWTEEAIWPKKIFNSSHAAFQKTLNDWLASLFMIHDKDDMILGVTSNGLLRMFRNEKVKTGNFCELKLYPGGFEIESWNQETQI